MSDTNAPQAPACPSPEEATKMLEAAFSSPDGLVALASSMANPIRFTLDYQAIGRKLMFVDPLQQGQMAIYDLDFKVPVHIISKRGQVPDRVVESERITVPTHEIATYPSIRYSHIREKRFNIIERVQTRAKLDLMQEEDSEIFNVLNAAATDVNTEILNAGSVLARADLINGIREVVKWDLPVAYLTMSMAMYTNLLTWNNSDFDPITQREVLSTGLLGHLWNASILESKMVSFDRTFVTSEPEFVGVIPVRQDVNVIPADKPEKMRLGFVCYEELGFAVTNPRGVARVRLGAAPAFGPVF